MNKCPAAAEEFSFELTRLSSTADGCASSADPLFMPE